MSVLNYEKVQNNVNMASLRSQRLCARKQPVIDDDDDDDDDDGASFERDFNFRKVC